jgi:hypothetical protein
MADLGRSSGTNLHLTGKESGQCHGRLALLDVGTGRVLSMSEREERVARNEATSREINEGIELGHQGSAPTDHIRMVCECGVEGCDRLIAISIGEYERIRDDPRRFAVVRDHVREDMERVVAETDRFVVVQKREGTPARVALEEDPRG